MGRTTCTEPQCLYKGALYLYLNDNVLWYSLEWFRKCVIYFWLPDKKVICKFAPFHAVQKYRSSRSTTALYSKPDARWILAVSHWIGGSVVPRDGLDVSEKRKITCSYRLNEILTLPTSWSKLKPDNDNIFEFYVYGSVHRWSILIIVQRDATQSSLFIILQVHSTCFECQP